MQNNQIGTGPLEDHLRNLILAGSDSKPAPHLASSNKAPFTETRALPSVHSDRLKDEVVGDSHAHPRPMPRGGRKRPNQAQRRQMNAELSIPIDTRASFYASSRPSQYGQQQTSPSSRNTTGYPASFRGQSSSDGSQLNRQSRHAHPQFTASSTHQPDWRGQQYDGISKGVSIMTESSFTSQSGRNPIHSQPALYNPGGFRQPAFSPDQLASQSAFLNQLCFRIIEGAEIEPDEISEKENFRLYVESICRHVVTCHEHEVNLAREFQPRSVELKCFGSLASGFATKAADMDLGLVSPMSRLSPDSPDSPIPRLIEGALLAAGFGARLLTKTRVPIIKLCEKPSTALRQGLLDSRKKWEEGADQEERDLDDDDPEDVDLLQDTNLLIDSNPKQHSAEESTPKSSPDKEPPPLHDEAFTLKQSSNQSLANYYGRAKRLLRRLNSRDISQSNCQDFTEADYILLDKVAGAFVKGLHDAELRSRILAYPSFNVGDTGQLTNHRSLFGVNVMIECEQVILLWEAKQLASANPRSDQACESVIQQWRALQHRKNFGTNPVWFNKELQLFAEAIRQNPSIQMMQLRQDQHESPTQYQARTNRIAIALPGISLPSMNSQIIQRYVDGIRDEEIRNEVCNFMISTETEALGTVARKHKALHLAADYERAIEKGLYAPDDVPILQSYIAILRRQPVHSLKQSHDLEYLIPMVQSEKYILEKVRKLADPATLSPNKPKDKYNDSLEFPKSGIGVQCDINFSAQLALQNTLLLRCYSCTDRRVRPLVLFVKHWAKARGINTPYRGTLSSYGYVLMVLHYLVNVVEPFVCPNLQELAPPDPPNLPPHALEGISTCQGRNVRFWRDERAIQSLAQQGQLNQNHDSLGTLLQGFFEYYAQGNTMSTISKKGFNWGRDVISLRTHGGLLTKVEKSWTGAKTVVQVQTGASPTHPELDTTANQFPSLNQPISPDKRAVSIGQQQQQQQQQQQTPKPKEVKEVRHRFLFAIEDPFELDHNVARTVTHNGIVSIRDEFRRAWRIIRAAGDGKVNEDLLEDIKTQKAELEKKQFLALLDEIHGDEVFEL
ncbi:hypothetical protein RRF57_009815 [Xylaria bambusicola]|uniref:polynucleotide adenylyltransferase n=1 Tax=Xylaria bambusicola TaxID=326684 RepID=A0AAN7ZCA1_9PEZI